METRRERLEVRVVLVKPGKARTLNKTNRLFFAIAFFENIYIKIKIFVRFTLLLDLMLIDQKKKNHWNKRKTR